MASNHRLGRQRGALIFITPVLLTTIALFSVMAVDGARLYDLRNQLQNQANAAASAGADAAQACGGNSVQLATMAERALVAAQAQGFSGSAADLQVLAGFLTEDPGHANELAFRPVADVAASNAVHVTLSREEPISRLLPQAVLGSVTLSASASVRKEVVATLSAGGSSAGVNQGLLGNLLGAVFGDPSYSLDPTSLDSLENTFVELGDLLTELGVASVADMLPLGADELAAAMRDLAGNATPAGQLLDEMVTASGIHSVQVAEVLSVVEGSSVPRDSRFRSYDLFTSLLLNVVRQQQLLNGTLLSIPDLATVLPLAPEIANGELSVALAVNRAPTVKVGPARKDLNGAWLTRFYAPDLSLQVVAELATGLSLPAVEIDLSDITLTLGIDAGGGHGDLASALCARGASNSVGFGVDLDRQVLQLASGAIDPVTGEVVSAPITAQVGTVTVLGLPVGPVLDLETTLAASVPGSSGRRTASGYGLYCDPATGCHTLTINDSGGGLSGLTLDTLDVDLALLGGVSIPLDDVTTALEDLFGDLTEDLLGTLVDPLLQALGVGVGGVTVTVLEADQDGIQLIEDVTVLAQQP
ncbi:MAG: hypothetical protein MI794_14565 [Pseudomonadales bacterium]|nr:hypothetical protein [Pseudomonadales bacterium]